MMSNILKSLKVVRSLNTTKNFFSSKSSSKIVDLRSDTVTKPSQGMREAMSNAVVGDDVFGEDPTINSLENRVADLLGFDKGLFFPTATMSNLAAIGAHTSSSRLNEIILGDSSHIFIYECGGASAYMGCSFNLVPNLKDGSMNIDDIENPIRDKTDIHQPHTNLICIESSHNKCGGTIPKPDWTFELSQLAKKHDSIPIHIDGSRFLNSCAALDTAPADLAKGSDSVTICLSKGLGCPLGSILVGSDRFIHKSRHIRKSLGGGMRQAGVIAQCGHYALDHHLIGLKDDNNRAKTLAIGVSLIPGLTVTHNVETNIVFFTVENELARDLSLALKQNYNIMINAYSDSLVRCVTHLGVNDEDIYNTLKAIETCWMRLYDNSSAKAVSN